MLRKYLIVAALFLFGALVWAQSTLTPNVGFQIPAYQQTNWQVPYNYNWNYIDTLLGGIGTLAVNSATPSVSLYTNWITANTSSTAITNFQNGFSGQLIRILCQDTYTSFTAGSTLSLNAPFTCSVNSAINFVLSGTTWYEIGRDSSQVSGVPAKADATAQSANISATTLYAVPANGAGTYRFSCYVVVTQAATSSSTMPNCQMNWTDKDSATTQTESVTPTSTSNTVGTNSNSAGPSSSGIIEVAASTNIQYITANYASSGATAMQYAVHVKLEYLGP